VLLVHRRVLGGAVDLARRDEEEALDGRRADRVEQDLRPFHVRRDEFGGPLGDRLLDVRLGSGVDDHVHLCDDPADQVGVADVSVHEREPIVRDELGEIVDVAGVRERVQRDDLVGRRAQQVVDDVRRDEAGAARDEDASVTAARAPAGS
jgi:hypothetical protein